MQPPRKTSAFGTLAAAVWIIAAVAIGFVMREGRDILAPFALAVFVWLIMEGFARVVSSRVPQAPKWLAHAVSVAVVVAGVVAFISIMRRAVIEFAQKSDLYETRINDLIEDIYGVLHIDGAPTLTDLLYSDATARFVEPMLSSARGLASDLVLIFIYVAFLYISSAAFSRKLDHIFIGEARRGHAREVGEAIRDTMEQYLWVQTALSVIITALTYATLVALGLDNAVFWAVVVFVLNYIPTVGSVIAAVLPALFAMAQPDWPAYMPADPTLSAVAVFLGVSAWQFLIGNFVGPRMMGDSLNLDPLVVLLSLAVWGAIWGIPGMFLSAPLTVLLMIVLSQTEGAAWVAVLLSSDGNPGALVKKTVNRNSDPT